MKMRVSAVTCVFAAFLALSAVAESKKLVVYSSRKEHLVKPLFDLYEKKTGVKVEYLTGKDPVLVQKLKAESKNSPADVLLTVDAGNLYLAQKEGLLHSLDSKVLNKKIPAHLRDPEGHWYGFSIRARPMFYNKDKVKPEELNSYEKLAEPKWKGRLCLRTSKKVYNQSLVAMMLSHHSEKEVSSVLKGWVANLAAPVFSSDTLLLKAIEAGQCDVGIANSYYYGRLVADKAVSKVMVFWPNQKSTGAHVNISGAGIVSSSQKQTASSGIS
jgi:iron(III) transport system substrate-binding protein